MPPSRPSGCGGKGGWGLPSILAFAVLGAGTTLSLIWLVCPWYAPNNDAAMYIVCGRSLLRGEGYSYLGDPFVIRPPGLSVLLVPVLAIFGTDFVALNLFISLFGVASVLLLFVYSQDRLGPLVALALCVSVWLNPLFRRLSNNVLSDVPGLALILASMLLDRWARRRDSVARDVVVGAAVGAAAYVRTLHVLLVPAILLARLTRPREAERAGRSSPRRLAVVAAVPILLLLPWHVRNQIVSSGAASEHTVYSSYSVALWHSDPENPDSPRITFGDLLQRVGDRLVELPAILGSRLERAGGSGLDLVLGLGAILCLLVQLVRRRSTGEWLGVGILMTLMIYFLIYPRYLLPVYVFALVATAEVMLAIGRGIGGERGARAIRLIVALGLVLLAVADFAPRSGWTRIATQHRELVKKTRYLADQFAPEVPLAAHIGWHYSVYLDDRDIYNLEFVHRRSGMEGVLDFIERHQIGGILLQTQKEPFMWNMLTAEEKLREKLVSELERRYRVEHLRGAVEAVRLRR